MSCGHKKKPGRHHMVPARPYVQKRIRLPGSISVGFCACRSIRSGCSDTRVLDCLGGRTVGFLATDVGLQAGGLATKVTQVIELGTARTATAHNLDLTDERRVDREDVFDAFARADLADSDGAVCALAVLAGNDHTLESLDSGAGAFNHAVVDAHGVARVE